ncbi:hypothetical protein llap_6200 [Limosa lapponica baueri]|uniref:Glucose-6-phosphate dehydrogenase NAD-binding domain-containing protein n=1 Tax=Limosa lapponica baueri TaxID=1758121 RepID=A0A2I0UBQ9_LIMLA|nr:hypothetical protein llap_6200 [Limosa lapponica baueri]
MVEKPCRSDSESSSELPQHLATLCSGEQLYQTGCYLGEQIALNLTELPGPGGEKPAETVIYITDRQGLSTARGHGG